MNKDSKEKELGKLSDESFDFKHITWKISNVLTLPGFVNYEERSPSFSFAGATWKLAIYPYGQTKENSEGYIDLFMVKLNSLLSYQVIFFKFCFLTKHGKEFESFSNISNFGPQCTADGVVRYITKSKFREKKNILAPNGVLTVICQMRTKKITGIDRCYQIESTASLLESSTQTSWQEAKSSSSTYKESSTQISWPEAKSSSPTYKESSTQTSWPEAKSSSPTYKGDSGLRQSAPLSINKTLRDLKELFLKQEECDVIIKVKGQEFRAHKAILIARSPVFASTFRSDMKEKSTGIIDIEDCDPSFFSDFLYFLYCGNVDSFSTENVYSLFTTADKYNVEDLRSECLEFMKKNLSVNTFCETVILGLQHLEKELIDLATDFFAKHLQEIIVTVKWQRFVIEYPVQSNEIMIKALVPKGK